MLSCPKCGYFTIEQGDLYCSHCGYEFDKEETGYNTGCLLFVATAAFISGALFYAYFW